GYPWVDQSTKRLDVRVKGERGRSAAHQVQAAAKAGGLACGLTAAAATVAQLDAIGDAVTRLREQGVPHAELIWMTEPDHQNNRVVITMSERNSELLDALAARFGTDRIPAA